MKKNLLWILSFVLLGMLAISSCNPEETCVDADCVNGSCFDGGCVCDVGYALDISGFCTECAEGYEKDIDGNCVEIPECVDADCPANASCVGNECLCDIGYEDDGAGACVLEREKFAGVYDVVDVCTSDTYNYEVTIDELIGTDDVIRIQNLANLECFDPVTGEVVDYFVEATVVAASLSFVDYTTCDATFTGSGTMDTGVITLTYSLVNPNDDCTTTLTKK